MSFLRPIWLNLAILAAFGLQVDAVFGQVFSGLTKQAGISRSSQGPHYFTILGHVANPNCYELPTASPSLVKFVQFAGNPTPTASGSIRIVRDGRTVQSVFYREQLTEVLVPGDILVVDGKINHGRIVLRGNQKPEANATAEVSLAITGLRDYPVILTVPSERATIRWVTLHLGLDPGVANYVKAVTQRQSERVFQDTRLSSGTVLAFMPKFVDQSRLPDNLQEPVRPGRATNAQPQRPIGPAVRQPLTGTPSNLTGSPGNEYGAAAPGRARVPTIGPAPSTPGQQNQNVASSQQNQDLNLSPDEQAHVKELLTDPSSVPLDEPTPEPSGRAFVSEQPASPRPTNARPANSIPNRNPAATSEPAGSAVVSDVSNSGVSNSDASNAAAVNQARPETTVFSPEANRPYRSEPAAPESLQPLGSSRNALEGSANAPRPTAALPATSAAVPGNAPEQNGFRLALQGANLPASTASTTDASSMRPAAESENSTQPQPSTEAATASPSEVPSVTQALSDLAAAHSQSTLSPQLQTDSQTSTSETSLSDGSRLLPPPPSNVNWPVISILTVGLLGAIAACFLIYSIAHENPAPRVSQIDTSGRYWLDRMIENDIPIEEEEVDYPHNTQLFGKPAPIQRVDAAHRTVPRPHFSAPGDKSGVLKETPNNPDTPVPDLADSKRTSIVKIHSGGHSQLQSAAKVPTPHTTEAAARQEEDASTVSELAATAVFGDAGKELTSTQSAPEDAPSDEASKKKPRPKFRLDTGHRTSETTAPTVANQRATSRKSATVQPSPVVVQGANLLDRILSSVEHQQTVQRPKSVPSNLDKRPSDERGNS